MFHQAAPCTALGGAARSSTDTASGALRPVLRWRPSVGTLLGRTVGWALVMLGVVLMPLPGPGTLVLAAGLRVLVPHHRWAAAAYGQVRDRAIHAARSGVATWPRVATSVLGLVWVVALATAYVVDVPVPELTVVGIELGPSLPLRSTATIVGLLTSGAAAVAGVLYTVVRWGPHRTSTDA